MFTRLLITSTPRCVSSSSSSSIAARGRRGIAVAAAAGGGGGGGSVPVLPFLLGSTRKGISCPSRPQQLLLRSFATQSQGQQQQQQQRQQQAQPQQTQPQAQPQQQQQQQVKQQQPQQQQQQQLQQQLNKVDYGDMQTLMERDHFVKIKKRLEKDTRRKISIQDFRSMCAEEGLSQDQATRLCQSLSDSGFLLHFPNSANKKMQEAVFLRPQEINATVHNLLEHYSPAALKLQAEATQSEIQQISDELAPLKSQRQEMEKKAARRANLIIFSGLGYCVLQFLAIGRLTWWELSWDVMEPVTYMLTFGTALIGYTYFVLTGTEYTYEGLKKTLRERKLQKLIKRNGFDEERFKRLQHTLLIKEEQLHSVLEEIRHAGVVTGPTDGPPASTILIPPPASANTL